MQLEEAAVLLIIEKSSPDNTLKRHQFDSTNEERSLIQLIQLEGEFLNVPFMYFFQHCCICFPLDSTEAEDAGIEPSNGSYIL
jgi:hypothetical protein